MNTYRVYWSIDVEAETPAHAVAKALEIQRDPNSIATAFEVQIMARSVGASWQASRWTVDRIDPDGSVHQSALRFDPDTEAQAQEYIDQVLNPLIGQSFAAGTRFVTRYKTFKRK